MRRVFKTGDLVEACGILEEHDPKYIGVIVGRYKYSSDCYAYKVKWSFKDRAENWSPRDLSLICAGNKNK